MNYFSSEDMDCLCYIEEKTNNVVIKFFNMPDHTSAELFTMFAMNRLGFDENEIDHMKSYLIPKNIEDAKHHEDYFKALEDVVN